MRAQDLVSFSSTAGVATYTAPNFRMRDPSPSGSVSDRADGPPFPY